MGYELVGCELFPQGRQIVFRIYIDSQNGVTVDDCTKVSHQVSAIMDVVNPIQGNYALEVSSPGIDRPLFEIEHYRQYIGRRIKIRLYATINGRRQYKGILQYVKGEDIYLLEDDATLLVKLPFSNIEKGYLIGDIRL
jgi:ribosome maturation factor RimP